MKIKILVMDVDGTLTDGKVYVGNDGELFKTFHIKDGYGIKNMLPAADIVPVIITGRSSRCLENRCRELGIVQLYQGIENKRLCLEKILDFMEIAYSNVAYIGDDINDFDCMTYVKKAGGLVGCPADAVNQIGEIADYKCVTNGGEGAVREFIEWIFKLSNIQEQRRN